LDGDAGKRRWLSSTVLLLEELVRFGAQLDGDWHHPVANAAARLWDLPAPRFVRSSASHVLVANARGTSRVVLRLRPDCDVHRAALDRGARAAAAWFATGAPVAPALPSIDGRLVETVDGYVVMAMEGVEGPTLEEGGVADGAHAWGATLARLHTPTLEVARLPHAVDLLRADGWDDLVDDRVSELRDLLARLPRSAQVYGTLHGDAEPDNAVAGPRGLRLVDPDEARMGWYAADIAFALRAWAPPGGAPDTTIGVPRRFLAGYAEVRPFSAEEHSWLPLLARAAAVEELLGFGPHLAAASDPTWPAWAIQLDARLRARAGALREALA
jgi:Ser/Thr protein kinase RdoA (MazF antagonist)